MAVYVEQLGRKNSKERNSKDGKIGARGALAGPLTRFLALLVVAGALLLLMANVAQPHWLAPLNTPPSYWVAPVQENPILIPAPWSGQDGA